MFKNNVWRYGVVDVIDDSRRIRHGMIVDLVADGGDFIVDFDYPDHHAERVPVANCVALQKLDPLPVGQPVRVLLKRQPDQPWCWYSAQLLALVKDTYWEKERTSALVGVYADGDDFRDVVPCGTICGAEPLCQLTKKLPTDTITYCDPYPRKNVCFRQHLVKIPNESVLFKLTERKGFRPVWSCLTKSVLVHTSLLAETLVIRYISTEKKAFEESQCSDFIIRVKRVLNNQPERQNLKVDAGQKKQKRRRLGCDEVIFPSVKEDIPVIKDDRVVPWHVLPLALVLDSLSYIPVNQQLKCRQVSRDWDTVFATVITAALHLYLEVDTSRSRFTRRRLAFTLGKCVTSSTRTLIITTAAADRQQGRFAYAPVDCIAEVVEAMQIRIPLIILWQVAADYRDLIRYSRQAVGSGYVSARTIAKYRDRRWAWPGACVMLRLQELRMLVYSRWHRESALAGLQSVSVAENYNWLDDEFSPGIYLGASAVRGAAQFRANVLRIQKSIMHTAATQPGPDNV
ncbi:uncharacterized protein LOC129595411 [Paramacrobiotus metropolitanus]|uniref:uncharacterized protein LOC129595411 n=1 Tax=Paramacrobiotus metropolitanus TaxID=2943436 RepID=UPI00244563EF|nr:uncharacterized protein LOC129595411 [Paramacrobiotus metropolitanus]XP_055348389.1 uncharacterized protein LOC129595411 [Paramacrobiotus metropolitanus]XP_055348390.1 uncharacterized protein LOC129595411 [Paramacrobiotus metropolitanus]XP_055348391.1 uncharacterized protein LOC129595411 [Paramacrobiotus metropolitanus]